jgi:hypothetical protein
VRPVMIISASLLLLLVVLITVWSVWMIADTRFGPMSGPIK